jgi:hypothetical protein
MYVLFVVSPSFGDSHYAFRRMAARLFRRHFLSASGNILRVRACRLDLQAVVITVFALLIAFGAAGNSLVCYVVARNPAMRTPRNIFIINLAISDLTLCLFTQPFNVMKVLVPVWRLGTFMCKFIPMFCGVNVFVSTISITAIALDRFQVGGSRAARHGATAAVAFVG